MPHPLARIDYIAIHCSATPPSMDVGVEEIRQWHLARGWADVGYHFVVRRNGTIEKGRPVTVAGAHVEGYNLNSLGICLVGGVDETDRTHPMNNFTSWQMDALFSLVSILQHQHPDAVVQGHRDFPGVHKSCPCFDARLWWSVRKAYTLTPR
jgi:N-acetylmuramoyl-L-alanine amidase